MLAWSLFLVVSKIRGSAWSPRFTTSIFFTETQLNSVWKSTEAALRRRKSQWRSLLHDDDSADEFSCHVSISLTVFHRACLTMSIIASRNWNWQPHQHSWSLMHALVASWHCTSVDLVSVTGIGKTRETARFLHLKCMHTGVEITKIARIVCAQESRTQPITTFAALPWESRAAGKPR